MIHWIKHNKKKMMVSFIALTVISIIIGTSIFFKYHNYQKKVANTTFNDIVVTNIEDGTYIGEYDVDVIYVKVEVTIQNHQITDIILLEHKNERGESAESIIETIIQQQRLDVDVVSSATNSSKVIRKAIENALTNN